jgi:hypothetical protein
MSSITTGLGGMRRQARKSRYMQTQLYLQDVLLRRGMPLLRDDGFLLYH